MAIATKDKLITLEGLKCALDNNTIFAKKNESVFTVLEESSNNAASDTIIVNVSNTAITKGLIYVRKS